MATEGSTCFQQALNSFKTQSGPGLVAEFEMTSLTALKSSIAKIEKRQATERRMQNMRRLYKFVDIMERHGANEVFVTSMAYIKPSNRAGAEIMQVASSVSEAFNELLDTYKVIGESIELLENCNGLIDGNHLVKQAVVSMFQDIFEFHQTALAYFRKPMWKQVFQATWSTYKAKFGPVVDSLKRHKQVFGDRLTFAQLENIRSEGIRSSEALKKLQKDEEMGQLRDIQCWLNSADIASDQDTFTSVRSRNTQAGIWILRHQLYCAWKERKAQPMLWVNGIPGAGKTILASIMVEDCLKSYESTAWFYFRNGDAQRSSFLNLASSLISQLLEHNCDLLPYVFEEMCRKGKQSFSSEILAKELLHVILRNSGHVCIILDGLDECSRMERKKILDWICLVSEHPQDRDNSYSTICLLVSQRDGITSKALRDIPSLEITAKDTRDDILAFLWSRGSEIQTKFQISDESTKTMVELVMEKAGDQSSRPHSLQLLGWLVCAKRRLKWREIQGAVSVDLEGEDVDFESRQWILDSRDLCDSLVEVKTDGTLEFVHATAKQYLIRAKFVDVGQVELDMASLCVGYLALPGFEIILPDESVTDFISTGYYAFLDYAVCFWSFHLQEGLKGTIDREDAMTLIGFLSKFLESHYRRPTKDFNIPSSAHELRRRIEEHGPWSAADNFLHAFVSAQSQINCYTQDAASNVCLNIPDVISRIRDNIERAVSENVGSGRIDSRVLYSFYGRNLYKCPRTSCDFFHQGFETPQQRESHLSKHDRPFGCSFPQCYRATIRFGLKRQLEKHIADTHEKHAREMHAFPSKRIRRALLCRFCKKEFQETSTFRKHDCTRPAPERSENLDTTDMSSTPGVKATRRKPHVTNLEWLSPDEVENMSRLREQDKVRYKQPVHNRGTILNGYGPVSPEYWIELSNAITKARELQEYQQNQRPIKQQEQSHDTQAVQQATAPDNLWIDTAKLLYGIALQKQDLAHHASLARRSDVTEAELDDLKKQQIGAERSYKEGLGFLQNFKEQQEKFKAYWREKGELGEVAFTPLWSPSLFDPYMPET
ncbi:hypothetical protein RIB2604_01806010 [Aspergillus luchuensis]|uniref:Uncharacterized protein n=1 Tax=Aspergillus kawachii TaxID=1069201 RepID=A0A146FFI6_ASPKA|nr:hypothetical protein RIB2604_01806010 [Aspergillus luchuensis]